MSQQITVWNFKYLHDKKKSSEATGIGCYGCTTRGGTSTLIFVISHKECFSFSVASRGNKLLVSLQIDRLTDRPGNVCILVHTVVVWVAAGAVYQACLCLRYPEFNLPLCIHPLAQHEERRRQCAPLYKILLLHLSLSKAYLWSPDCHSCRFTQA